MRFFGYLFDNHMSFLDVMKARLLLPCAMIRAVTCYLPSAITTTSLLAQDSHGWRGYTDL